MPKVRVDCFSVSVDGFGAGPRQALEQPMGVGGMALHEWVFGTRTFNKRIGKENGRTDLDEEIASRGMSGLGAWILGRNMFGPIRGEWPDDAWKGWWGTNPPYHTPVFVLTHHPRASIEMEGGTVFHFITDGIEAALERAKAAAGDQDIRIGGGASTVRQYLEKRLIDEIHLAMSPVLLGSGEPLLTGLDLPALGYRVAEQRASEKATHVFIRRATS